MKTKECVNCGDSFVAGEGYPVEQNHQWECCCSAECWKRFCGVGDDEGLVFVEM